MSGRDLHRVTTKCAFYSPDGSKVLVVEYTSGKFGLPGGHVDAGEIPDDAMKRELAEELGLVDVVVTRRDFWTHNNGKIILGYTATLDESTPLVLQEEEVASALWVTVDDVASGKVVLSSYDQFVCEFRPQQSQLA